MSVDGIGKKPPQVPSADSAAPAKSVHGAGTYREVASADRTAAQPAEVPSVEHQAPAKAAGVQASSSGALAELRAGRLDVHGYLDLKVHEATRALSGLPPHELESIRKALRAELASDPGLADLVKRATGSLPPAEE